jgi:hypothetical protein
MNISNTRAPPQRPPCANNLIIAIASERALVCLHVLRVSCPRAEVMVQAAIPGGISHVLELRGPGQGIPVPPVTVTGVIQYGSYRYGPHPARSQHFYCTRTAYQRNRTK